MSKDDGQKFLEAPIEGKLLDRLVEIASRHAELEESLGDPDAQSDRVRFQEILKEHGEKAEIVGLYKAYQTLDDDFVEAKSLSESEDEDERELGLSELEGLEGQRATAARQVREHILDREVEGSEGNAIIEVRAGTGGDEAALFVNDVFKMYSLYAEAKRWKIEVLSSQATDLGGYREITFAMNGRGAFGRMRFESGGHRVQRVPETETQGRIHTSAITVAVLPEVEETEVEILDKDLRIDTFCASGPGGQKVNKTASAVRITHEPTGIVVSIQDEKSQHKNKAKALKVLRSRIRDKELSERQEKEGELRRSLIGSGDRSDRIRTYNFPQSRVTDHRIGVSLYSLDRFMAGDIDPMLDQLASHDREQRVQSL